ncbi:NAD(P)/FAD-dependent oxidoreductase [Pseudomonas sp. NPDC089406]|uniref:NAD(P)/FAD-dependent oxidoreductase n=1 Tax=Pseudomonas sp. NPDC089406 TaxID=3364463 RepID=UPI00384AD069
MSDIDCLIIGAGVIGLACAAQMARAGNSVMLVEQERRIGEHTSSRNSEVIHAGIYYPPGSLKARLCVEGRDLLYAWCQAHGVNHRRIGKLLVAVTQAEVPALEALESNARHSGVDSLEVVSQARLRELEPAVAGVAALFSPQTGIIDSHGYMESLLAEAQRHGADLALDTRVERLAPGAQGWEVEGVSCAERFSIRARTVINAAGLFASQLAARVEGLAPGHVPATHWCQGRYFGYSGRSPFSHLVYPMPEANTAGLGVHATLDLGGQVRFGPDVAWTETLDYRVDESLREDFSHAIRRYFPAIDGQRLTVGYSGIRPKLSLPGQPAADFNIQGPEAHGLPGLVNLYGIESPGLTASLAIALHVLRLLERTT